MQNIKNHSETQMRNFKENQLLLDLYAFSVIIRII